MTAVVVVDYGMGNIKSVQRGLEKVGASVLLSSHPEDVASANHLVLPGVGAFKDGMNGLRESGVIDAIDQFVQSGNPLLGICLGMQMLMDFSEEHGINEGLGYIPGSVNKISQYENEVHVRKIPHIGWNTILCPSDFAKWDHSLLNCISAYDYFYFVHSFTAVPSRNSDLLGQCEYEGLNITAAVHNENVTGLQFHPEKSGNAGLKILSNFVKS
jgi:glutamine amidotransferase